LKIILDYIRNYLLHSDKKNFIGSSIFCAVLIFLNYYFQFDRLIGKNSFFSVKLIAWALVFTVAFGIPVWWQRRLSPGKARLPPTFYTLFFIAVILFALKYTLRFQFGLSADPVLNHFWNKIIHWPALLVIVSTSLLVIQRWLVKEETAWGTRKQLPDWRPYIMMLLFMVPLISLAATQPDFQAVYPKLNMVAPNGILHDIPAWQALLFELSYGSDFLTIELFFRGFLILGFAQWLGKDAILPVAIFYCSIHFGKPVGECISSFFGGLLLGIVVYNTRSIWGGLIVHLGIAWMMEAAGILLR
jgi:membrane protease YdiL (CAAX protease family)